MVIGKRLLLNHYREKADIALFLSGDYKAAIEYYGELIWWQPKTPILYYNRGDAFNNDGQFERAISDYNKSIQLGIRDSLQAYLRIALTNKKNGNYGAEGYYLQKLLDLSEGQKGKENEFWAANYHLGQLEFKKKNYQKAITHYNIAHKAKPTKLEIYHRANSYFALGQIDSANQDLKHSLSFVKAGYVRKYPNSNLAKCDTCAFPFGSKEYELLTEPNGENIIQILERFPDDENLEELNEKLKSKEKNSR